MFDRARQKLVTLLVVVLAFSVLAPVAISPAQEEEPAAPSSQEGIETLWENLLHYIKVGRAVAARSYAQAILDSDIEPRQIYLLSVETPESMAVLARGEGLEGMAPLLEQISEMISTGYEAVRSDPEQIATATDMLDGTLRAYKDAVDRLVVSGEYALPQLMERLQDPQTSVSLKYKIATVLPQMGREAVRPLSVALQARDPNLLEYIIDAIGQIRYPHAAARLRELLARKDILDRTRQAARDALVACSPKGEVVLEKSVAEVFYDMALKYYYGAESILPDPRYETANVWYWIEDRGLSYTPVPRETFCDVYAMRMARLALKYDPQFYPSVSLWLAAYLRKEATLPEGATDPTQPEGMPSARFYALASPAKYLQDVLARALKDEDTAVALGAIEALAKTAGAKSLVQPVEGGVTPLVEAMHYPDRQVRYLAALSLANALPRERFDGHQLVMSVFQEALRQTGKRTALLVVADDELRNRLKEAIRQAEYNVIDERDALAAMSAARASSGVDVAVVSTAPDPSEVISRLRRERVFATLPALIVSESARARSVADQDPRVIAIDAAADEQELAAALSEASRLGLGKEMSAQKALDWAVRVADSLRLLGLTNNGIYDIERAIPALTEILEERRPAMLSAAGALAMMPAPDAQQAIAQLANSEDVDESIRIEAYHLVSESGRRFGNQLSNAQAQGILDVVTGPGSQALKEAAAQALGVLSLPSEEIKDLILGAGEAG